MSLFAPKPVKYLNITYNDDIFNGHVEELFDYNNFNEIKIVSYVSSIDFFFKIVKNFKKIVAILGEEETAQEFYTINTAVEEELIKIINADEHILRLISNGQVELRYMKSGEKIHSKIYILSGDNIHRVMVGSANLTKSAFSNHKQYEELIVYDSSYNDKFCHFYLKRFDEIYENSVNFINNKIKQKINKLAVNANNVILLSNNDKVFTVDDKIESIIDKINNERTLNVDVDSLIMNITEEKEKISQKAIEIEKIEKIAQNIIRRNKNSFEFETKEKVIKIKDKLREIISMTHKNSQNFINKRNYLYFNFTDWRFYIKKEEQDNLAIVYSCDDSQEKVKDALDRLINFVNSYKEFTIGQDKEVCKRVFEAILYAFTSPFFFYIRQNVKKNKSEEKIAEIPIILILGGNANTGKTKLLLFINRLLGNNYAIFNYKDIYTKSQRIIYDFFYAGSNNVFPILIDEIHNNFFRGEGEKLIKSITNTCVEPHPCLIGTSNVGFTAESQIIRRIYYLHFNSPFPEDKYSKEQAETYFEKKVGNVDDTLFRYFLSNFLQKMTMTKNDEFYKIEDPLYLSRKIFAEMFEMFGYTVPDFLSEKPCGDYYKIGSQEWYALYLAKNKEFIKKKDKETGEDCLIINLQDIYKDEKYAEAMKNKLPPSIIKSSGTPLVVYKDRFLEFIGKKEDSLFSSFRFFWKKRN
ncbi:MAG: phospholipase D family protein [Candidatus Aenigmarchaeota archaeon]|nr:phospholipase D family protein [Candidatus Aenigmarchaeota archaeon]MDW8149362.1 phospholipase D family protein [Candidatus Aenigmarchaeota archaeon]